MGTIEGGGPLAGVRVVDVTIYVQGPIAGTLLADLGADVIKVEKPGAGDFSRAFAGMNGVPFRRQGAANLLWATCNRNKRSLALDLGDPEWRGAFEQLVATADVFLTNLQPDGLERFEIEESRIRSVNPRIVYARGAGLGEEGPRARDACQDTIGLAYGGLMSGLAGPDGVPYYPPGALNDVLAGTMLAFGVLAALRERDRTGEGQYVSSSQLQSVLWLQSLSFAATANLARSLLPYDRAHPVEALVNTYRCADDRWIALGLLRESHWPALCQAIGRPDLISDDRFADQRGRSRNSASLSSVFDREFLRRPAGEWLELLRAAGLWVAPVNGMEDLVDDPQVLENGYALEIEDGLRVAGPPFSVRTHRPVGRPAPGLGEHTAEILAGLALDVADLGRLLAGRAATDG